MRLEFAEQIRRLYHQHDPKHGHVQVWVFCGVVGIWFFHLPSLQTVARRTRPGEFGSSCCIQRKRGRMQMLPPPPMLCAQMGWNGQHLTNIWKFILFWWTSGVNCGGHFSCFVLGLAQFCSTTNYSASLESVQLFTNFASRNASISCCQWKTVCFMFQIHEEIPWQNCAPFWTERRFPDLLFANWNFSSLSGKAGAWTARNRKCKRNSRWRLRRISLVKGHYFVANLSHPILDRVFCNARIRKRDLFLFLSFVRKIVIWQKYSVASCPKPDLLSVHKWNFPGNEKLISICSTWRPG